ERRKYSPTNDISNFNLTESDLETVFGAGNEIGIGPAKLKDIIAHLEQTYCQSVGAEYKYIRTPEIIRWLETKMESSRNTPVLDISQKKRILSKLNEAQAFENFLHTKFAGQKRFSLEGAETMIPAIDAVIESGAELGIKEFVIGMAHRGRLNVLANILNKTYEDIFTEFEGKEFEENTFDGDVKYHLGFSGNIETRNGKKVHLSLTPNPSHLEAVNPVVQGIVRAKIDNTEGGTINDIAPVLIHGDAAIAAQGVVYEVIQMSQLKGYSTGGTIHIVINNQIGFTTNYTDARSSTYCTDIAKVTLSPVFHVNGDDVEALVYTIQLAMEYRQKFHRDVFIDLLCYRKYGHNEGDEPRFTQPLLYKAIAEHPGAREIYVNKLLSQGAIEAGMAREMEKEFKAMLQQKLE
ncbi:MAG: thiamine pyrophosphate-dependent enzyme, partial [Alphaproteobacteria bacterium]